MSEMIIEVCQIKEVKEHPNADRLEICVVKGWNVISQKGRWKEGDVCIYIPYDSVLPPELANGPDDNPPGRLNVAQYCAPIKETGASRVRAARLRGERSFGIIMKIEPNRGDNVDWKIGDNVADHFGITKWDPPEKCEDGDAAKGHPRFHKYIDIERYQNFPDLIQEGEEVVFTEKIHGKNNRIGLILELNEKGEQEWIWAAGSHGVRRKEKSVVNRRFNAIELAEQNCIDLNQINIENVFKDLGDELWQITEILEMPEDDERILFKATQIDKDGNPIEKQSDFWRFLTDDLKTMLEYIRDEHPWSQPKEGIVAFGEFFGNGVQSMNYGRTNFDFRLFDIAINEQYLDFDVKEELCKRFNVPMVPILYKGPFSVAEMEKHTDGTTTLCDPKQIKGFKGREGIVITPIKERKTIPGKRVILKSVSVDYLAQQDMSDNR